ncbi:hypothetical protein MACJ_002991 [Theileria orientalis]|uniref:Uncharacterized protein n=1 Tax=Theileria orientalis TaxID=68886 RepID=A0A976M9G3_THEOR|nr:hypothetical protein MACJ_002991 [Theileria orientalis]
MECYNSKICPIDDGHFSIVVVHLTCNQKVGGSIPPDNELESEKKLQEINESIKEGVIEDPITKAKLFQNEDDEQPEVEEKEVSLDSSGESYNEGVESTSQDMNDISKKLESDGVDEKNLDDIQLRENLLNKIMKSQHSDILGT